MKTKIMKKLISVVCALAIATSCVSVSVGAVPVTTAQVDWAKGYNRASELVEHADEVRSNGHLVSESNALADAIEEFLNGAEYNTIFSEISDEKKDDLVKKFDSALDDLRSNDVEKRQWGIYTSIVSLVSVVELMEPHTH